MRGSRKERERAMAALRWEREMERKEGERVCRAWPILLMERGADLVRVEVWGSNASVGAERHS